ncbi:MAG: hypothetical protein JXR65_05070 [Bacteroidales bacterium]|nr:hypothetical protein [Bacteroidales bacterium]
MKNIYKSILLIAILVLATVLPARAQLSVFKSFEPLNPDKYHNLSLNFESSFFLQNNEYFNQYIAGATGIGVYAKPTLQYYFMPNLKVSAGVFALKYAGRNNFSQITPILSIQYEPIPQLDIVMGSIYGPMNHQLAEPIFRYERFYENPIEYGLQFLLHTDKVKSELWLHWVHFIVPGDTANERLTVGNNTTVQLVQKKNWSLELPFQWLIIHTGGQLAPPPRYTSSIMNGMSGLTFKWNTGKKSSFWLQQQYFLYYGANLTAPGNPLSQPYKNGFGTYSKIRFNYKNFSFMSGYWYANRFIAPKGSYMFQSVSSIDDYTNPVRKLWTTKIWYHKNINNKVKLEVRLSTYYDLAINHLDYAYSFYFILNQNFFLARYKH